MLDGSGCKYVGLGDSPTYIWEWIEASAEVDGSFPWYFNGNRRQIYFCRGGFKYVEVCRSYACTYVCVWKLRRTLIYISFRVSKGLFVSLQVG